MKIELRWWEFFIIGFVVILVFTIIYGLSNNNVSNKVKEDRILYVDNIDTIEQLNASDYLIKDKVSCDSDSMGLVMSCDDWIFSKIIEEDDELTEGWIYSYKKKKSGGRVIHRLVKDCTKGCFGLIFKGDNNYKADPVVNRDQIVKEVYQIRYG